MHYSSSQWNIDSSQKQLTFVPGWRNKQLITPACLHLQESMTWMPYVSIACVIIYVIGHAIGPSESDPTVLIYARTDYNRVLH